MATITVLKTLQKLKEEQEEKQRAIEEKQAPKIGRSARVRFFHWLPPFFGIIPRMKFNPNALRQGQIIGEKKKDDGMESTIRFQNGGQPYWDYYPADAIEILPQTK